MPTDQIERSEASMSQIRNMFTSILLASVLTFVPMMDCSVSAETSVKVSQKYVEGCAGLDLSILGESPEDVWVSWQGKPFVPSFECQTIFIVDYFTISGPGISEIMISKTNPISVNGQGEGEVCVTAYLVIGGAADRVCHTV